MNSTKRQLLSGVFYNAISKYSSIIISLGVTAVLSRLLTPDDFAVVAIATVIITFFTLISDMGIAPAIIQHQQLDNDDLDNIFSFTVWSGTTAAILFFFCSPLIAHFYDSPILINICRLLSINLLFASLNITPNALLLKAKRFRFIAKRTLIVQGSCGVVSILAALYGAGLYALLINPIFSSIILFGINFYQYPRKLHFTLGLQSIKKIFSFSAYQFLFNITNYFSRNLDKLLVGKYMNMNTLGYYEKSYRLMMLPLQNITQVVSPVMHTVFADFQNDLKKLADSYIKVVRVMAFIGFPLTAMLYFSSRELILILFGDQWGPSVPVFSILALSVGVQIILSTSGSIFQAANATKMLFISGLLSTVLNVAGLLIGLFVYKSIEAVAWAIVITFTINFVQCYLLMFLATLKYGMKAFLKALISPLIATAITTAVLYGTSLFTTDLPMVISLIIKGTAFLITILLYIQLTGEYNLKRKFL